jgi:large-conductance mechanosensitive channel
MGLLERTSAKVKTVYGLLVFLVIVGAVVYAYSQYLPITIIAVIIALVIFVVWDMYDRLTTLEKEFDKLKHRRRR